MEISGQFKRERKRALARAKIEKAFQQSSLSRHKTHELFRTKRSSCDSVDIFRCCVNISYWREISDGQLVWVCVAYTAATFTVDLIDSCWCAGEILYDIYKQRRKQAEKVSRKKKKKST